MPEALVIFLCLIKVPTDSLQICSSGATGFGSNPWPGHILMRQQSRGQL